MTLSEKKKGAGVICALEGVDIVKQCREHKTTPVTAPGSDWMTHANGFRKHMDIDVSVNSPKLYSQSSTLTSEPLVLSSISSNHIDIKEMV